MNDRFTPSINDLSGALTLPLISRLFAEYQSIEKMDVLLQMLTVLFRYGHTVQAYLYPHQRGTRAVGRTHPRLRTATEKPRQP